MNKILFGIFLLLFATLLFPMEQAEASAKGKAPIITYSATGKGAKNGRVKLFVKITDKNGLRSIKYANGFHRKPFFIHSYYSAKVKKVSLTSTTSMTLELEANANTAYTFFALNKKGKSTLKKVSLKIGEKNMNLNKTENNTKPVPTPEVKQNEEENPGKGGSLPGIVQDSNVSTETPNTTEPSPEKTETPSTETVPTQPSYTIDNEVRAAWITFLEFQERGYSEYAFRRRVESMFTDIAAHRLNQVYVHVRPFSDAMYRSSVYPWSKYASGEQGKDPGYDPLAIMVEVAKTKNLKIHAYINPYRVDFSSGFERFSKGASPYKWAHPAYRWLNDADENNDRNVLKFGKMYYYNPSKPEVIDLITDGVKEIVENYAVDGIIFDDYFYPYLGNKYKSNFDAEEYDDYETECYEAGITPLPIVAWRKENINKMVKSVYATVKAAGKGQLFGISPAGNLSNLRSNMAYYVDIDKWGSEPGFVDYLAPQLYWGFESKAVPYEQNVRKWMDVVKNPLIKLYIALPIYKAEAQDTEEWKTKPDVLARMLLSLRAKGLEGYSIYRYDFMTRSFLKKKGAWEAKELLFDLIR